MQKVVILGSGNVASHLAARLSKVAQVAQVYSPHLLHAQNLASTIPNCQAIDSIESICKDADFYLISVSDTAIPALASRLPKVNGIVAHTSGSVSIDVLNGQNSGVFYPLQTFSKEAELDMCEVPFFIEAYDSATRDALFSLARLIAPKAKPQYADSEARKQLHIAAVFACNFANHLWAIADDMLKKNGYSIEVLYPLLKVTLGKAMQMPPAEAQTGPAARGDLSVIHRHLEMLSANPQLKEIYSTLSNHILSYFTTNNQNEQH